NAAVVIGTECAVTGIAVACRKAPALRTIAGEPVRVGDAVGAVDQGVRAILLPIIRIAIAQSSRVEAEKRKMRKEQRPAARRAERQGVAVKIMAVAERRAVCPTAVIDGGLDRVF